MKKFHVIGPIVILLIFSTSIVKNSAAISDQNLSWGIEEGARFDYNLEFQRNDDVVSGIEIRESFYVIVQSLPDIPDDINRAGVFDYLYGLTNTLEYWENGTQIGWDFYQDHHVEVSLFQIFPVGNWTLILSFYEEEGFETMIYSNRVVLSMTGVVYEISKADGAVLRFHAESSMIEPGVYAYYFDVTRVGYVSTFPDSNLILMIVGGGAVVLLVIVIFRRRKYSKKDLLEPT